MPFPIDGTPTTVGTVIGTSGTMNFTLELNDPTGDVFGDFALDVFDSSSNIIGKIELAGGPFIDGASNDFGDITNPPGVSGGLPDQSLWHLTVSAGFPLTLLVTSTLTNDLGDPVNAVLTVDFTNDLSLQEPSNVPLPGALALFTSGRRRLRARRCAAQAFRPRAGRLRLTRTDIA